MRFLNYIEKQFARILAVDTEYITDTTNTIPEKVICLCYTDVFSGEVFRYWEYDKKKSFTPHFDRDWETKTYYFF